ncbi:Hypothetical predicted protein [Pelobates cultripes]|uniref:Uncharacterized protein n=1 Tax=Pelobates cultripes TaxID=61616 RepID=A0AAD1TI20_PELCU|nr:Hypothetical predicted protein [Pelobates cultripes]CAH2325406.1 Hypothetical predicted protein [Pelobates cultripes]
MGSGKKKKDHTPSVAALFRTTGDMQRPTNSQHAEEAGSDSEGHESTPDPMAPLMIGILCSMLDEVTANIKYHVAKEINKQLSGLKTEVAALFSRTNQAENKLNTHSTHHSPYPGHTYP